jgi:hypothetical protein
MANYYDEYVNKVKKSTEEQKNILKAQQATADKVALDRLNADNKALEENFGAQIDEANSSYDTALRTNEVQRALNERQIERRMAEMGLTDSGLNRTQSTAVQLSYANQKGNLIANRQKAVDTLAAAMRSAKAGNELGYNETIAKNKLAYESGIADIDAQVAANASKYESDRIKADNDAVEAQRKAYNDLVSSLADSSLSSSSRLAKIEAYKANYGLSDSDYESLKSLVGSVRNNEKRTAYTNLLKDIDSNTTEAEALAMIYDYAVDNDVDVDPETFLNNDISSLLAEAGVDANAWTNYFARQQGVNVPVESNSDVNAGNTLLFDLSGSNLRDWLEFEKKLGKDSQWQIPMNSTVGLPTVKTTPSNPQGSNGAQGSKGSGFKVADTYENVQAQNAAKGLTWLGNLLKGWL